MRCLRLRPASVSCVFIGSRARAAHKLQALINREVPVRASRTARRGCAMAKSRPYSPRWRYDCLFWAGRVCAHSGRISRPEIRMNGFRDPFCHLITATLYECPVRCSCRSFTVCVIPRSPIAHARNRSGAPISRPRQTEY
ncbi:hypothetical protein DICSQDRAFT_154499, partial [Dichomitus squalens LYAD-421 SS1]|uniref:uncharacterized protein n=1 Tax=Dichomitus squalens (strain LYAD-421) TaxID=732165 RepID=UPI0004414749